MDIGYLIQLLDNKLNTLALAKDQAFMSGDLERINALDSEINGVKDTLFKLKLLTDLTAAASTTGSSESQMVATGIEAVKEGTGAIFSNGNQCLNDYDISSYATDPLHEQKIADILLYMGPMETTGQIDAYIGEEAIASPLTGVMVMSSASTYEVDVRLMMALMELDSRFGTAGVAVNTLNPGNVGNTGTETKTYSTWAEGVTAVAEWLSRHRKNNQQSQPQIAKAVSAPVEAPPQQPANPETPPPPPPQIPILGSLVLVPDAINAEKGATQKIAVTALDQQGNPFDKAKLVFFSNNEAVASIDEEGLLKAVSAGSTNIVVQAFANDATVSRSLAVNVVEPPPPPALTEINVSPDPLVLEVNSGAELAVILRDQYGKIFEGAKLNFTSDNNDIAAVATGGVVMGVLTGSAIVLVEAKAGDVLLKKEIPVTVNAKPVEEPPKE